MLTAIGITIVLVGVIAYYGFRARQKTALATWSWLAVIAGYIVLIISLWTKYANDTGNVFLLFFSIFTTAGSLVVVAFVISLLRRIGTDALFRGRPVEDASTPSPTGTAVRDSPGDRTSGENQ